MKKKSVIVPTGHRVLIKPDRAVSEERRESGIVIPIADHKNAQYSVQRGTVLAVGPDAWKAFRTIVEGKEVNGRPWAQPGDRIWFSRGAGRRVNKEEEDHLPEDQQELLFILNDEDVCAVIHQVEDEVE